MKHCHILARLERIKETGRDGFHRGIPAGVETWLLLQYTAHPARGEEVLTAVSRRSGHELP